MTAAAFQPDVPDALPWLRRLTGRIRTQEPAAPAGITRLLAFPVPANRTVRLPQMTGPLTLHCRRGTVWLTEDGEQDDLCLREGDSVPLARLRRATAHALKGPAALEVQMDL